LVEQFDLTNEGLGRLEALRLKRQSEGTLNNTSIIDRFLNKKSISKNTIDFIILESLNRTPLSVEQLKGKLVSVPSVDSSFYEEMAKRISHLQREHFISPVDSSTLGPLGRYKFRGATKSGAYSKGLCEKCCSESLWNPTTRTYSCECGDLKHTFKYPSTILAEQRELARVKQETEEAEIDADNKYWKDYHEQERPKLV